MQRKRVKILPTGSAGAKGHVIYWMSRDMRVGDNWALFYAQEQAKKRNSKLSVIFNLLPKFLDATWRQYSFMLGGLEEVEGNLRDLNIPFILTEGKAIENVSEYALQVDAALVVMDLSAMKHGHIWREQLPKKIPKIAIHVVDAGNIVPVWEASDKQEWAARTIRPKIHKHLPKFLKPVPEIEPFIDQTANDPLDWSDIRSRVQVNREVGEVDFCTPGEKAAREMIESFIAHRLKLYEKRNDPNVDACSNFSPYLHFGHMFAGTAALAVKKVKSKHSKAVSGFIEELVVRRELAFNFCYYNRNYDQLDQLYPKFDNNSWAQKTLKEHRNDPREYVYTRDELERGETHSAIWNAAQKELVLKGKMHGFMRMLWCKKILEWTRSPEEAMAIGIYLNDKYSLDGRDPNGYIGVAWSVAGIHDRAFAERPVFGKIRFMSEDGCKRKFKVEQYLKKIDKLCRSKLNGQGLVNYVPGQLDKKKKRGTKRKRNPPKKSGKKQKTNEKKLTDFFSKKPKGDKS